MHALEQYQAIYEDLADHYERKGEPRQRDVFLVLAAYAAHQGGRTDQAERLRQRLMQLSPHNLLRPYSSFSDALLSQDIQDYLVDLRRQYPPEQALTLMRTLHPGYQPKGAAAAPSVYRFQPEPPAPAKNHRTPLAASKPAPVPPPAASPYATFAPYTPSAPEEGGGWLATLLFLLVLLVGVAVAVWVLGRPFIPV